MTSELDVQTFPRIYKPTALFQLDVPEWDDKKYLTWHPTVIALKWTKNHHHAADTLTVTIDWSDGGVDVRWLKHGRVALWLWDEYDTKLPDPGKHLRFTGIVKSAERKFGSDGYHVDLTCHDYTTMFLGMKPFPTSGMPEWSDSLPQIWQKICDNTGYRDRETGKIVSSVEDLRENLVFIPFYLDGETLGSKVSARFKAISKPTPKHNSDAWAVWRWCCESIGLVTYIEKNTCVVTTTNENFKEDQAPQFLYGNNILDYEEHVDSTVPRKGILGKSFDPLRGVLLESAYPPPGDDRIKKTQAQAKAVVKAGSDSGLALNAVSPDYIEQNFDYCTTQEALDACVESAYEEFSKQELRGRLRTAEMRLHSGFDIIDILSLRAGDSISIGMDKRAREILQQTTYKTDRINRLMASCGYVREVAELVATNMEKYAFAVPIYHVETVEVDFSYGTFMVDIAFHNKVVLK